MAAPSMVFTARFAARHFGVDLNVIQELAEGVTPEDGCLRIVDGLDDDAESTTAFTRRGLYYLDEFLGQRRSNSMQESCPIPRPFPDGYGKEEILADIAERSLDLARPGAALGGPVTMSGGFVLRRAGLAGGWEGFGAAR